MNTHDADLIQRILDGDEGAFTALVNKYQKSVHALVWRKIGDFHIAEEITQDVFLKVYKKLSTLKPTGSFSGLALCDSFATLYRVATERSSCQRTSLDARCPQRRNWRSSVISQHESDMR